MSRHPYPIRVLFHVVSLAALVLLAGCGGRAAAETPTVTGGATSSPASDVVFQDSLTTDTNGWSEDQHIFIEGDGLHIVGGYYILAPVATAPADIEVSVQATRVSGPDTGGYGIVMRRTSGNRYEFDITGKGEWYVLKDVSKQFSYLVGPAPDSAIKTGLGATNALKVRAQGDHFEFWVNDVKVGEVTDATNAAGAFGLDGDDNLDVAYTNLLAVAVH